MAGIFVPSLDKLPAVIDTLIAAVRAGEIDDQLTQAAKSAQVRKGKKAARRSKSGAEAILCLRKPFRLVDSLARSGYCRKLNNLPFHRLSFVVQRIWSPRRDGIHGLPFEGHRHYGQGTFAAIDATEAYRPGSFRRPVEPEKPVDRGSAI